MLWYASFVYTAIWYTYAGTQVLEELDTGWIQAGAYIKVSTAYYMHFYCL